MAYRVEKEKIIQESALKRAVRESWRCIAPAWTLKNLIAVNPLQGLEHLSFEEALHQGGVLFRQKEIPKELLAVNRETIKWCHPFFDQGQAVIEMPHRQKGLWRAWRLLVPFDVRCKKKGQQRWIASLSSVPEEALEQILYDLDVPQEAWSLFCTLALTTLPGWAAAVKYRDEREGVAGICIEYLTLRIALFYLFWPEGKALLDWHAALANKEKSAADFLHIKQREALFFPSLLKKLKGRGEVFEKEPREVEAQWVFCIDVRSERLRRTLESVGSHETFGAAGFFALPVEIENRDSGNKRAACPVLLSPAYSVSEQIEKRGVRLLYRFWKGFSRLCSSLKYTFCAPFALVELFAPFAGLAMLLKNFFPTTAGALKKRQTCALESSALFFADRCACAEALLCSIGLTKRFAPVVIFCGHESSTENNAFASALDCGACGGHSGAANACLITEILNEENVRTELQKRGIEIPKTTRFLGAKHDTTTDQLVLLSQQPDLEWLQKDLKKAGSQNRALKRSSRDWAEIRPEWGLARNGAFIAAPRSLTEGLDLEGRCFLHSYVWEDDPEGKVLATIMTAPLVVAQWINAHYLFCTLDNTAFGSGSKVTQNIAGKMGVMQGNGSDLMQGLARQSLFSDDATPYHEPVRLMGVVMAPRHRVKETVSAHRVLRQLVQNGWIHCVCLDPQEHTLHLLDRALEWENLDN